jgi:uncharacterized protein YndB with AHSA1/START domain
MAMTIIETAQVTMPSDREVQVVRSFRAPGALVYRAFTEPSLVRRWMLGPPGWSMPVCEMDVRVGGAYRWRWRSDEDGSEFGFHGTFREVQPPDSSHRGVRPHPTAYDPGREARDAAVATGMTDGMEQSYALLDRLLGETTDAS